jgi:hypothetical protein
MAVPTGYLITTKNLDGILSAIQRASVPQKFTYEFLKQLGFASSGDRGVVSVLKSLRFLDDSGVPLDRYKRYRDATQSGAVLAEALRDAFQDVFALNENANELTVAQIKGLFSRLTDKGETVVDKMATSFKALADRADFVAPPAVLDAESSVPEEEGSSDRQENDLPETLLAGLKLHHDIHVHLPVSDQVGVYNAIFRALRQNFST